MFRREAKVFLLEKRFRLNTDENLRRQILPRIKLFTLFSFNVVTTCNLQVILIIDYD